MAYRLKDSEAVSDEIKRIVEEQIDRSVAEIDAGDLDAHTTVHQLRKRCKKIRAVLRLARGPLEKDDTYSRENAFFRDLAADLSELRDAEVMVETHDALTADIGDPELLVECAAIRENLAARRSKLTEEDAGMTARLQAARLALLEGRARVPEWAWRVRNFQGLEPGLKRTYGRGRRAMRAAYRTRSDGDFHEWRKRVKYHWYACRLLRRVWPAELDARRREAGGLAELLGGEHDLSVYRTMLEGEGGGFTSEACYRELIAAVDQRRGVLRGNARAPGTRLYAEKPAKFCARFAEYWSAWRSESN